MHINYNLNNSMLIITYNKSITCKRVIVIVYVWLCYAELQTEKKNIATIEAKSVEGVYLVRILTTSGYLLT